MDYKQLNFSRWNYPFIFDKLGDGQAVKRLNKGILINLPNKLQLYVRWMNVEDISLVCALEHRIFPTPWPFESFLYKLENRNFNISIVGLIGKKLVTYAISYLVFDEIHISNLAVAPDFRRLKIGETMLWITLQISNEKNCPIAHLEVRKGNTAAISLYQKYGFKVVGVRKNYYQNENEDALLMTRKLDVEKTNGVV